jgi:hypothetical protein
MINYGVDFSKISHDKINLPEAIKLILSSVKFKEYKS